MTQRILDSLRNNGGVTSKQLNEVDHFFGGKVIDYNENGAATVDATGLIGSFYRKRYGDDPYQIFGKHYAKMVEESHGGPYQFIYTWSSWGQHHETSAAHVNVKNASKLFMVTEFERFLKMDPTVSDLFRLFEHLPETDHLTWHWLRHGYPHRLDLEALKIPNTELKTDLEAFAARFYNNDFKLAVVRWLVSSSFDVPQQSHGGRFNDFNSDDSLRRYHELVGKILGVAVKDKGISVKDLVVPLLQTASKEYPAGSVQFGPSIPPNPPWKRPRIWFRADPTQGRVLSSRSN